MDSDPALTAIRDKPTIFDELGEVTRKFATRFLTREIEFLEQVKTEPPMSEPITTAPPLSPFLPAAHVSDEKAKAGGKFIKEIWPDATDFRCQFFAIEATAP